MSSTQTQTKAEPTHEERMNAARAYAGWHLGYRSWADNIVNAYLNPKETMKRLLQEQER